MQSSTTSTLKSEMATTGAKAQKAARAISEDVSEQAKSLTQDISGQFDTLVNRAQDVVKQYEPEVKAAAQSTINFVKRNPVACLLGAAAIGYAIVAFSRRNRG